MSKERPILFSGAMVRAILEGRKTQTRRVITPQGIVEPDPDNINEAHFVHSVKCPNFCDYACGGSFRGEFVSPYGKPGDRLWVRETIGISGWHSRSFAEEGHPCHGRGAGAYIAYQASGDDSKSKRSIEGDIPAAFAKEIMESGKPFRWRPSIHMPRWASRISLEIVKVRVERVQDITEEDAKAEGAPNSVTVELAHPLRLNRIIGRAQSPATYREGFQELWNSINLKRGHGWAANDWVRVIEFKRVQP